MTVVLNVSRKERLFQSRHLPLPIYMAVEFGITGWEDIFVQHCSALSSLACSEDITSRIQSKGLALDLIEYPNSELCVPFETISIYRASLINA